ncbi:MAG TPA: protein kinase, partial [Polyangiales bacterium]|nr:protein kinase [Polyangiales bacterium]
IDRASGQRAALKVLRADADSNPAHLQRFRKEARILSQLRSPYIASLIEWNHDAGVHYIALELVPGGDLAKWLEQQGGRVHEHEALAIVAEVCRGLGEAHTLGIVHRDIKPQNIMLESASERVPRLKLCDFGIARALDGKSGTIAFTQHDRVIGTPDYMAPEQATGSELTPATDVYALGVMLFLMISGRLPFEIADTVAILVAHTAKPAPKLAEVCPDVSEATAALVDRMLAKRPVDRFADANILLDAVAGILHGVPSSAELHPARPAAPSNKLARHAFEYHLEASPDALWPYVSNTDRLNRAVGLPPVAFKRVAGALGVETYASNRVMGVSLRWRVQPFEWVEGQRWGVLRVFDGGVMHWFTVELELQAKPGGGTLLRYTMVLAPRHVLGKWIVAAEMRWKQRPALARVFARIDEHARKLVPAAESSDAFEPAPPLSAAQRAALTQGIEQLAQDGVAPGLLDALAKFCEQASDQQVTQLRPLEFARERGLDADALVDACLRGAYHGLFVLLWEVLCPLCRVPSDFAESLRALADHGHCPSCNTDFPLDFAQSLELVFRVSRAVRESELRTYCVGGPAFAPHVAAQMSLAPGERMQLTLALSAGTYKIRSPQLPYSYALQVSPSGSSKRGRVRFTGDALHETRRILLAPGTQLLELENKLERELVVRVERAAPRE